MIKKNHKVFSMKKPKILIVEDECIIALEMKKALEKFDFEITNTVTDYDGAINSVKENKPDIILMDIDLKNSKDGIETIKTIHTSSKIPTIYISAFNDEKTINRAIETEPVSYLIKPLKIDDLKSNILLGLYKNSKTATKSINKNHKSLGLNYYYCNKTEKLFYKDLPIRLSRKESLLLKLLVNAKNKVVTFQELESQLWPSHSVSESTLRTLIYRLRGKLEYKLIETIPSIGCKLNNN